MCFFYYECWQQMTGFLQIGKNGSGLVLTLLVVSQKANNWFLSYYRHLMSTKYAFRQSKFDGCGCPNFEVMSSRKKISVFWDTLYIDLAYPVCIHWLLISLPMWRRTRTKTVMWVTRPIYLDQFKLKLTSESFWSRYIMILELEPWWVTRPISPDQFIHKIRSHATLIMVYIKAHQH